MPSYSLLKLEQDSSITYQLDNWNSRVSEKLNLPVFAKKIYRKKTYKRECKKRDEIEGIQQGFFLVVPIYEV